jgi:calcium/proton exchanger cax
MELAEAVTCLALAYRLKIDLVVTIALGTCMQIALFLTPFLVILGWIFDVPMSLSTPLSFGIDNRIRYFPDRRAFCICSI